MEPSRYPPSLPTTQDPDCEMGDTESRSPSGSRCFGAVFRPLHPTGPILWLLGGAGRSGGTFWRSLRRPQVLPLAVSRCKGGSHWRGLFYGALLGETMGCHERLLQKLILAAYLEGYLGLRGGYLCSSGFHGSGRVGFCVRGTARETGWGTAPARCAALKHHKTPRCAHPRAEQGREHRLVHQ